MTARWLWPAVGAVAALLGMLAQVSAAPVAGVCAGLLREWDATRADLPARIARCARLAALASEAGPHVALTLALAYHETHFGEDTAGAVRGACQVAACHCPGRTFRGCDLDAACVATVARLMSEEQGSEVVTLRRWLRGPRGRRGFVDAAGEAFLGAVRETARVIERALARGEEPEA